MPVVVLIGMLDVQGLEYAWLRDRLVSLGTEVVLVDTGMLGTPRVPPDIPREEVAQAAEARDTRDLDPDSAIRLMARGAAEVVRRLSRDGRLDAALSIGGHGNSAISAAAMRALPDAVPKLVIAGSAEAPADAGLSLIDSAGIGRISERALAGAAAAITRMATGRPGASTDGPIIGLTVADVTAEGVHASCQLLSILGYEILLFRNAGPSYEALAGGGLLTAALDATLLDLSTELVNDGSRSGRLKSAAHGGIPQVVSLGGLDMARIPTRPDAQRVHLDDEGGALVRITPDEAAELGRRVAARLRKTTAPTALYLPLRGLSSLSVPGGPFHDPVADDALAKAVRDGLSGSTVEVQEMDTDINDPVFGRAMADHLHTLLTGFPVGAAAP